MQYPHTVYLITSSRTEIANEVDDTVVADPLISVHLLLPPELAKTSLCYEFHGLSNKYFNLLSNNCTSINAHYAAVPDHPSVNVVDEIAIRTTDLANQCVDISIDVECSVSVNGVPVEPNQVRSKNGVKVTRYGGAEVRVTVPGCGGGQSLGVQVDCQSGTLFDRNDGGRFAAVRTMRVAVRRGLVEGGGGSHGLLGTCFKGAIVSSPRPMVFIACIQVWVRDKSVPLMQICCTNETTSFFCTQLCTPVYSLHIGRSHAQVQFFIQFFF